MKRILTYILMSFSVSTYAQDTTEVKALLEAYGVKHVDIVLRQSILETGWYKCADCSLDYNNLFGFISPTYGGYMKFDTWQDSVKEYYHWEKKFCPDKKTPEEYCKCLKKRNFATDPDYIYKITHIK